MKLDPPREANKKIKEEGFDLNAMFLLQELDWIEWMRDKKGHVFEPPRGDVINCQIDFNVRSGGQLTEELLVHLYAYAWT